MDTIDCSKEYLAWDQTELATVTLKQIWNEDVRGYEEKTFENVVVRRIDDTDETPRVSELEISGQTATFLVAAALIDGGPVFKGDLLQIGTEIWVFSGDVKKIRAGGSLSHYRGVCFEQRG